MNFRTLKANEINVRIQSCNLAKDEETATAIYLLYKDARCDMNILDETVGVERWQRNHQIIDGNLYCNLGIKFGDEWIWKQDVGVESNTEAEKGQASDSFKRAAFNFGIGRELYTAPFIKLKLNVKDDFYVVARNGKSVAVPTISLDVSCIMYDESRNIVKLILTDNKGNVRFQYDKTKEDLNKTIPNNQTKVEELTMEDLEKQYCDIVIDLTKAGIDLSDEKVVKWIKRNAKVDEIKPDLVSKNELKEINKAMMFLYNQKKAGAKQ